jgi:hypothetical protein
VQLKGMKSRHATLLANATAGEESLRWHEAAVWLSQVEKDAQAAELAAKRATNALLNGDLQLALHNAQAAYDLESAYRPVEVWGEFRDAIKRHVAGDSAIK